MSALMHSFGYPDLEWSINVVVWGLVTALLFLVYTLFEGEFWSILWPLLVIGGMTGTLASLIEYITVGVRTTHELE